MTRRNPVLRAVCWALISAFAAQELAFAQGGAPLWPTSKSQHKAARGEKLAETLRLPSALGMRRGANLSASAETVVQIEDAHDSLEAQKKITGILDVLAREYDVRSVALEGSSGTVDASLFRTFPDLDWARRSAEKLMGEGRLSAGEFFAATSSEPVAVYGVEENRLYRENLKAFRDLVAAGEALSGDLEGLSKTMDVLAERVNNGKLNAIRANGAAASAGDASFTKRWEALRAIAAEKDLRPSSPGLAALADLTALENEIDFEKANAERDSLLGSLRASLEPRDVDALVLRSLAFREGRLSEGEYHLFLARLARRQGADSARHPNLARYMRYVLLFESIDLASIFAEVGAFEDAARSAFAVSQDEKTLARLEKNARVLSALAAGRASSEDYASFRAGRRMFSEEAFEAPLRALAEKYHVPFYGGARPSRLVAALPAASRFYALASRRDAVLVANTLKKMRAGNRRVAALVTGGFHTRGVSEILESEKLSYLVVTPRITDASATRPYITVLTRRPQSREKAFAPGTGRYLALSNRMLDLGRAMPGSGAAELERLVRELAAGLKSAQEARAWMRGYARDYAARGETLADVSPEAVRKLLAAVSDFDLEETAAAEAVGGARLPEGMSRRVTEEGQGLERGFVPSDGSRLSRRPSLFKRVILYSPLLAITLLLTILVRQLSPPHKKLRDEPAAVIAPAPLLLEILADPPWRFARNVDSRALAKDPALREAFIREFIRWEGRFHRPYVAYNPVSGLAYDGHWIDLTTGEYLKDGLRKHSAASKEAVHISLLTLAVLGREPNARLFVSPEAPEKAEALALDLLERKMKSFLKFAEDPAYRGYGYFLPWYMVGDEGLIPMDSWNRRVPSLDNGELMLALYQASIALQWRYEETRNPRYRLLSASYDDYFRRMAKNAPVLFYAGEGRVRTEAKIADVRAEPAPRNYLTPDVPFYLDDPYEGQTMVFAMTLFGGMPEEEVKKIWAVKRAKLEPVAYPGQPVTVARGNWYSAHEQRGMLFVPYLQVPFMKRLFRAGEVARTLYSAENGKPGLFGSSHDAAALNAVSAYLSDLGVPTLARERTTDKVVAPYAAFPVILADRTAGTVWLHAMLRGRKMQGPNGATEAASVDGKAVAPIHTWDGKGPAVLAFLGGVAWIVDEGLRRESKQAPFHEIVRRHYEERFPTELGEARELALPTAELPEILPDFGSDAGKGPGARLASALASTAMKAAEAFRGARLSMPRDEMAVFFAWPRTSLEHTKGNKLQHVVPRLWSTDDLGSLKRLVMAHQDVPGLGQLLSRMTLFETNGQFREIAGELFAAEEVFTTVRGASLLALNVHLGPNEVDAVFRISGHPLLPDGFYVMEAKEGLYADPVKIFSGAMGQVKSQIEGAKRLRKLGAPIHHLVFAIGPNLETGKWSAPSVYDRIDGVPVYAMAMQSDVLTGPRSTHPQPPDERVRKWIEEETSLVTILRPLIPELEDGEVFEQERRLEGHPAGAVKRTAPEPTPILAEPAKPEKTSVGRRIAKEAQVWIPELRRSGLVRNNFRSTQEAIDILTDHFGLEIQRGTVLAEAAAELRARYNAEPEKTWQELTEKYREGQGARLAFAKEDPLRPVELGFEYFINEVQRAIDTQPLGSLFSKPAGELRRLYLHLEQAFDALQRRDLKAMLQHLLSAWAAMYRQEAEGASSPLFLLRPLTDFVDAVSVQAFSTQPSTVFSVNFRIATEWLERSRDVLVDMRSSAKWSRDSQDRLAKLAAEITQEQGIFAESYPDDFQRWRILSLWTGEIDKVIALLAAQKSAPAKLRGRLLTDDSPLYEARERLVFLSRLVEDSDPDSGARLAADREDENHHRMRFSQALRGIDAMSGYLEDRVMEYVLRNHLTGRLTAVSWFIYNYLLYEKLRDKAAPPDLRHAAGRFPLMTFGEALVAIEDAEKMSLARGTPPYRIAQAYSEAHSSLQEAKKALIRKYGDGNDSPETPRAAARLSIDIVAVLAVVGAGTLAAAAIFAVRRLIRHFFPQAEPDDRYEALRREGETLAADLDAAAREWARLTGAGSDDEAAFRREIAAMRENLAQQVLPNLTAAGHSAAVEGLAQLWESKLRAEDLAQSMRRIFPPTPVRRYLADFEKMELAWIEKFIGEWTARADEAWAVRLHLRIARHHLQETESILERMPRSSLQDAGLFRDWLRHKILTPLDDVVTRAAVSGYSKESTLAALRPIRTEIEKMWDALSRRTDADSNGKAYILPEGGELYRALDQIDAVLAGARLAGPVTLAELFGRAEISRVLDAATGDGAWMREILNRRPEWLASDAKVTGYDLRRPVGVSDPAAAWKGLDVVHDLPALADGSFDLIHESFMEWKFAESPAGVARFHEYDRLLTPGGWMIFASTYDRSSGVGLKREQILAFLGEKGYAAKIYDAGEAPPDYAKSGWWRHFERHFTRAGNYFIVAKKAPNSVWSRAALSHLLEDVAQGGKAQGARLPLSDLQGRERGLAPQGARLGMGMRMYMSPAMSFEQRAAQRQTLSYTQRAEMNALMRLAFEFEVPAPRDAAKGLEGLKAADAILREKRAVGILVGSTAKHLWNRATTDEILQRRKDIDVVVLTDGFALEDPFQAGIDWFVPVVAKVSVSSSAASFEQKMRLHVNGNGVFVRAGLGLTDAGRELEPGLYLPAREILIALTEAVVEGGLDPRTGNIGEEVKEAFHKRLDRQLKKGLSPVWSQNFGGRGRILGEDAATSLLNIDEYDYETKNGIQHSTPYKDVGNREFEDRLEKEKQGARLALGEPEGKIIVGVKSGKALVAVRAILGSRADTDVEVVLVDRRLTDEAQLAALEKKNVAYTLFYDEADPNAEAKAELLRAMTRYLREVDGALHPLFRLLLDGDARLDALDARDREAVVTEALRLLPRVAPKSFNPAEAVTPEEAVRGLKLRVFHPSFGWKAERLPAAVSREPRAAAWTLATVLADPFFFDTLADRDAKIESRLTLDDYVVVPAGADLEELLGGRWAAFEARFPEARRLEARATLTGDFSALLERAAASGVSYRATHILFVDREDGQTLRQEGEGDRQVPLLVARGPYALDLDKVVAEILARAGSAEPFFIKGLTRNGTLFVFSPVAPIDFASKFLEYYRTLAQTAAAA